MYLEILKKAKGDDTNGRFLYLADLLLLVADNHSNPGVCNLCRKFALHISGCVKHAEINKIQVNPGWLPIKEGLEFFIKIKDELEIRKVLNVG